MSNQPAAPLAALVAALPLFLATGAAAQLLTTGPVTNGHHHLNASDIEAQMRFWVDTLGGRRGTFATGTPIVFFPDALIFLRDQDPTGGSVGTTVDHVAFSVPDIRAVIDRLEARGYPLVTDSQSPPGSEVIDQVRQVPGNGPVTGIAYVLGPDGVKVEILEMPAQAEPIVSHHIHFFGGDNAAMQAWYADIFGAAAAPPGPGFLTASLPALSLNFTATDAAPAGTTGRAIDHIGFEVADLRAFLAGLETKGITPTVSYREIEAAGIAIAFIEDPWGTSIELTEGLDHLR